MRMTSAVHEWHRTEQSAIALVPRLLCEQRGTRGAVQCAGGAVASQRSAYALVTANHATGEAVHVPTPSGARCDAGFASIQ